ncbi:beta-lactamase family protein [Oscillospiraceae bacterium HV4-5-C5C]|nr:beta-lactamase family protein [Oscillospiraceae bacterium HV4-5-C5C]
MDLQPLKDFMDQLTTWRIPGADLAVSWKGREVFRYQSGYADLAAHKPLQGDQLYNLYSVSKVFTCTAALQLLEKGKYILTDPVSQYLPEFSHPKVQRVSPDGTVSLTEASRPIRIMDLFTMSAGLDYDLNSAPIQTVKQATGGRCPTQAVIRALAEKPLQFEPGTHWQYSLCHDVLGALIEVWSGQNLGDYMRQHIFDPLGLSDTGFSLSADQEPRLAEQYRFNEQTGQAELTPGGSNEYRLGSEYQSGGAGLISSVNDCLRLADALAHMGKHPYSKAPLLAQATIELMRTNHLDPVRQQDFNWDPMLGYGYGLGVRTLVDRSLGGCLSPVGEFGWGGAAGAYMLIDPLNELSIFYAQHLLNSQEPYVHPRLRNLVYACLNPERF